MKCIRCCGECERVEVGQQTWHWRCADPACQPEREPRWRFALGLLGEIGVILALLPVVIAKKVWAGLRAVGRRVRR